MSINKLPSLSPRIAGHIRSVGPYSNTYRASAPMWTHKDIADRKSLDSNSWPLDMVYDGLIAYMNANDSECLLTTTDTGYTDGFGYSHPGLDQLADGKRRDIPAYSLEDFKSINPSDHNTRANRLYAFGQSANNAATVVNTDATANNGKSIYVNGNGNYVGFLNAPYHDTNAFPTGADTVKNITLQGFAKVYLNDGGPFLRIGWFGWSGHKIISRRDNSPDGIAIGIGSGTNTTNVFASNGSRIVARYAGVSGANFNTGSNWDSGWQMVTLTLDSSSTARLYKNTTLVGTFSGYTPIQYPSFWGYFGRNSGDGEHVTQMNIGTFALYNKTLSSDEILKNYNVFKGYYGLT